MTDENVTPRETSVSKTSNDQATPGTLNSFAVTYADRITTADAVSSPLSSILEQMRSSSDLERKVSAIRAATTPELRRELKQKTLPWFSMSRFKGNKRTNDCFDVTEFILIDIDHIAPELTRLRSEISADSEIFLAFTSPSGDGMKAVFHLDRPVLSDAEYRNAFDCVRDLVEKRYNVIVDADNDPARACFLSWDSDMIVNPDCNLIQVPSPKKTGSQAYALQPVSGSDLLSAFQGSASPGRTASAARIVGYLIEKGIREDVATEMVRLWNQARNTPPLDEAKIVSTVRDMYKRYGESRMRDSLAPFYSHGTDILDVGIIGEEFFLEPIGAQKFYLRAEAADKDQQEKFMAHIVKEKHIRHLRRVDHLGDADVPTSRVEHIAEEGVIEVRYAPIAVSKADNDFIEKWLSSTFGAHAEFIKQWLAVYTYTNYRKLPTLILKGDRGTGKNTFADAVMAIYPSISQYWHGEERSFTPEVQKKLLIADESVSANEKQYRMLKQRSGQKMAVVNQKYLPEYQVRNNMNIIVLSNEATPIFVQKDEEPTSEKNNQFFVFSLPRFDGEIDPDFGKKIEDRLGHYIRTELKKVYDEIKDLKGYRYSIPTPITDQERALFNVNQTGLEDEAMRVLRRMVKEKDVKVEQFFANGFFPVSFLNDLTVPHGYSKNGIIRNLKEKGYLEASDPVRKMVLKDREYCYQMTPKLKMWYRKEKAAQ